MKKIKSIFSLLIFSFFLVSNSVYSQDLKLQHKFLFDLKVLSLDAIEIGTSPIGKRVIYPAEKGTFNGPELKGEVLQNGGDWLLTINATTSKIDARGVLETDDGERIYIQYNGFIHRNDDDSFYFRINPTFETASEKYSWLNHTLAIGVGEFIEGGVQYKVYAIE